MNATATKGAKAPLRVLLLEDREPDARLVIHELREGGYEPTWERVQSEPDFLDRLQSPWDIILADYSMPQFDAPRALRLVRERGIDLPFIIVSGMIGEELAVDAMKEGASDYLLKDRLTRLGPAVKRVLEQRDLRRAQLRASEALKESRERTRLILDTAYDAFIGMDDQGRITDWNKQAEVTFGWSREEAIGRELVETIIPPVLREGFESGLARFLRDGVGVILNQQVELTAINREGMELPVEVTVWPVRVGSSWAFSGFLRDISRRKRLEEQLRQSQKMEAIGRLAGGVAHDFNNLLTVITGYSDMALKELTADNSLRELIEEIREASLRATSLTRQLLAFSRKQVLVPVVIDLNALVGGIEKMLGRLIGEDIDMAIRPAPSLWQVRVDPGQMEQVLMNLVVNARDAMPTGGKLTIETENVLLDEHYAAGQPDAKSGEHVLLAVSDTGSGMDRATVARIFEPFFTTKGPERGTGLGLATVYGIVKQSGGHIAVYSEPERGTCFKIYFPRVHEGTAVQPIATRPPCRRGHETVLLVEDEDGVRWLARTVLQGQGYKVLEAHSGEEATAICGELSEPVHLLATDVVLPKMSGRELAERLATSRPDMKVLFMSGYMDDAIVRHGLIHSGTEFLQKPYTPDGLAQKVREVLDNHTKTK